MQPGVSTRAAPALRCKGPYRGALLIRNHLLLGPYSGPMPRALCPGPYSGPRGGTFSDDRGTPVGQSMQHGAHFQGLGLSA